MFNILSTPTSAATGRRARFLGGFTFANYLNYFGKPAIVQSLFNGLSVLPVLVHALHHGAGLLLRLRPDPHHHPLEEEPVLRGHAAPGGPVAAAAMALISLFGANGLVTAGLLKVEWNIYGATGIIISEVLYCSTPWSFSTPPSRPWTPAWTGPPPAWGPTGLTASSRSPCHRPLRHLRPALVFNLTITDFGNPIIIGRGYRVLATEIYLQVIGMQRFDLGTTISVVLLVPSVITFLLNYYFTQKSNALISGQAVSALPSPVP